MRLSTIFLDNGSSDSDNWFYNFNEDAKIEIDEANKSINNECSSKSSEKKLVQLPSIKTLMSNDSFDYNETYKTSTFGNDQSMQSSALIMMHELKPLNEPEARGSLIIIIINR